MTDYIDLWCKDIPKGLTDYTDEILEKHSELTLKHEPVTKGQSRDLFTRAIVVIANKYMPWEYSMTDIVGCWIERTSEEKKVRKEVEAIYFELLADEVKVDYKACRNVLLKTVKVYNQRHGYLGRHKNV